MFRRNRGGGSPVEQAVSAPAAPQGRRGAGPAAAPQGGAVAAGGLGGPDMRFKMKQRMISFGDDFWIENERGKKAYKVNGKFIKLKDKLSFEDPQGNELYLIKARMVDVLETMDILDARGQKAAVVRNALITPFRDKWTINLPGQGDLIAQGNIMQHEYTIREEGRGGRTLAEISMKWFRLRDTYGVEVEGGANAPLLLAITVVIDMMEHNGALKGNAGSGIDLL